MLIVVIVALASQIKVLVVVHLVKQRLLKPALALRLVSLAQLNLIVRCYLLGLVIVIKRNVNSQSPNRSWQALIPGG